MKYLLILVASCIIMSNTADAQLQKGSVLVGGDITQLNLTLNSSKLFTMNIDPKAAWFVKDNIALGAYVNFQLATAKGAGTSIGYGVGALARYYIPKTDVQVMKSTRLFIEATAGVQGANAAHGGGSTNGLGLGIGPGLAYFVTPNVSLEALVKFEGIVGFGDEVSTNQLVAGIGFQIYLANKKAKQLLKGKI